MWGGMNVSPRANPEPQVYGEAEDAIAAGGGGKGGGGAGGSQERPRLTAEALMRVVEWKVREHGNKDEMKRVGAALHATPVGASSAGGVSSSNHRKGAGGGGRTSRPSSRRTNDLSASIVSPRRHSGG